MPTSLTGRVSIESLQAYRFSIMACLPLTLRSTFIGRVLPQGGDGMGKNVQWITHKGKRILFLNAAGMREAEYAAAIDELKQELLKERD